MLIAHAADGKIKTLIPYHSADKWGYANEKGRVVIPAQWDRANLFADGKAIVILKVHGENISCLIDNKGNYIIPPTKHWDGSFMELFNISDSLGNRGRIDFNGRIVIPVEYRDGGTHIYFDEQTKYYNVIKKQGNSISDCIIDGAGRIIIPAGYDRTDYISREPLYFFVYYPTQTGAAVLDSMGTTLLKFGPEGITCVPFFLQNSHSLVFHIKNYFLLWKNFPKGQIDTMYYNYVSSASEANLYRVQNFRSVYGAIDSTGKVIIDTQYADIYVGRKKIITEKRIKDTANHTEIFEYTFLDANTLLPLEAPKAAATSRLNEYRNIIESQDKTNDDLLVIPYIKCDEVVKQGDSVIYKKGDLNFVVSPLITSDLDFIKLTLNYKTYIPVKVYRRTDSSFLGYSVSDANLHLKADPQPYEIVEISTTNKCFLLRDNNKFAIADSNLRIVFPFQKAAINSDKYFIEQGKKYAVCSSISSSHEIRYYDGADLRIRQPIISVDGDTLKQFSKYRQMQFLRSNWSIIDKGAEHLMAIDSAGKTGIINFEADVLFEEISFKYKYLSQLGRNLFAVSNDNKLFMLVDKHNTQLFPLLSIRAVSKVSRRFLDPKREEEQVQGLYIISVRDLHGTGNYNFYINSKGILFTDSIDRINTH